MKQNNQNRRARGRGPRKPHGMGGGQHKGQSYEGGGHETRVRGNAYQVLEKYLQLARDAGSAGDRVAAENFLQHADHYYRVLSAMNDGQRPRIGGRELSVADVNVQNVSQGLSAAMYSGGSGGQGLPGMADTGNQADDGPEPGQGQERHGHRQDRSGQDRSGQDRSGQDRQGQDRQGQDRQGQRHGHGYQGRQHGQLPQHQGQPSGQGASGTAVANGHPVEYGSHAERGEQPAAGYAVAPEPTTAPRTGDEQPDYPDELLPATPPAVAPANASGAVPEGEAGREAQGRTPRGRLRGPRRGPKPPAEGSPGTATGSAPGAPEPSE